jgi:hypothetical protein
MAGPVPVLTIAISTLGRDPATLMLPPARPGWDVLVVLQSPPPGDLAPPRADVTVLPLPGRGLSVSRNAAMVAARGAFLLFADDDIAFDADGIAAMLAHLQARPDLALVAGQRRGVLQRTYPDRAHPLRRSNAARIATPELMIRLATFRARDIRFDTRFGLGAPWPLGEEFILVADALKAGLKGTYVPHPVGTHPPLSSGDDWTDPVRRAARAAALSRVFGGAVLPWATAFALRHWRDLGGWDGVRRFVAQARQPLPPA